MKKYFFLLLCLVGLVHSSCKKTYTCSCQATDTAGVPLRYFMTINGTENDAQVKCNAQRNTYDTMVYKHLLCAVPD